jgi:pyochelin biosynthetic protein PchC
MTADPGTWLHCGTPRPEAGQRLVCFPHAGGSASFFRAWGSNLPGIEVHAVRYPGRGERISEPPPTDLRQLGDQIAAAVASGPDDRPLALFGHSLGAVVALETARSLERRGRRLAHLFVSGSRDGECVPLDAGEHDDDDTVTRDLVSLGGTDGELAADPAFRELVLPYVRSDVRMLASYDFRLDPVLRCPVTAIVGDHDTEADRRPWRKLTGVSFRELVVPGDHFYLTSYTPYSLLSDFLGVTACR